MYQYQTINPLMAPFLPSILPPINAQTSDTVDNILNVNGGVINGNPSPVHVTTVTTTSYTALATDYFLNVDTSLHATSINLPVGVLGTVYIIKDGTGNASVNPITINGSGGQVIDGSVATINAPFGSISLIFNGSQWSIV